MSLASGQPTPDDTTHDAPLAARCRRVARGRVELTRGAHRWTFEIRGTGRPAARRLLASLARLADDPRVPLDWFDAALVAETLSRPESTGTAGRRDAKVHSGPSPERED